MSPSEISHSTRTSLEYSNIVKGQENDLKNNFVKMIEMFKEEISKSPKKQEKTNSSEKSIKLFIFENGNISNK